MFKVRILESEEGGNLKRKKLKAGLAILGISLLLITGLAFRASVESLNTKRKQISIEVVDSSILSSDIEITKSHYSKDKVFSSIIGIPLTETEITENSIVAVGRNSKIVTYIGDLQSPIQGYFVIVDIGESGVDNSNGLSDANRLAVKYALGVKYLCPKINWLERRIAELGF